MISTGTERYIRGYNFINNKSVWTEARKGEKVVIRLYDVTPAEDGKGEILSRGNKVISGVIMDIGTKFLTLETGPRLICKRSTYLSWKKIRIDIVHSFHKYPSNHQEYKDYKLY
jgi:hypothetical protein